MTTTRWLATVGGALALGLIAGAGSAAPISQSMQATANDAASVEMI